MASDIVPFGTPLSPPLSGVVASIRLFPWMDRIGYRYSLVDQESEQVQLCGQIWRLCDLSRNHPRYLPTRSRSYMKAHSKSARCQGNIAHTRLCQSAQSSYQGAGNDNLLGQAWYARVCDLRCARQSILHNHDYSLCRIFGSRPQIATRLYICLRG